MKAEWMGRYRELVAALVQHSNTVARMASEPSEVGEGVFLTPVAWQVLEYLIEHEDEPSSMSRISGALGIPQSSFSKVARQLTDLGLVERYQRSANRKNIILRPTSLAQQVYEHHSSVLLEEIFLPFFEALKPLDDSALDCLTRALAVFNKSLSRPENAADDELIKLE